MTDLEPFLTRRQINDALAKTLAYRDEMGYAPDDPDGILESNATLGEEIMRLLDEPPPITQDGFVSWLVARLDEAEVERAEAKAHEFESEAIHNDEIMQSLAAEVAALKVRIAEMEAADQWRPVSEPPVAAGEYLGWDGYRIQIVQYLPEYEGDAIDWPWWDRYDDEIEVTRWATLLDPPTEAPAV